MVREGELGGLSNRPIIIYDSLNHGCDVAKLVSKCLATALRILMARRVVGDNHVFISYFLERPHIAVHVHNAFVRPNFLKFVLPTNNISEMTEKYLLS